VSRTQAGAAFLSIVFWCLPASLAAQPRPHPGLAPAEVIRTVVEALQNRNSPAPNAGIFTVYQFSSPANRANTGPYGTFLQLVKSPPFVFLFSGHADDYSPLTIAGDHAEQTVRLGVDGGHAVSFRVVVSRQTAEQTQGRCTGCWMVDAVIPVPSQR
jgi:hypothetical protein